MKKPLIGVFSLWDEKKESLWMLPNYLNGLRDAGALPVIFPLGIEEEDALQLYELCDGFLFTGGHDVDPALYGEERADVCGVLCESRDRIERVIFRRAYEEDMPMLGICRGFQLINVLLGGTLYQDLAAQLPESIDHRMKPPYDQKWHTVSIEKGGLLEKYTMQKTLGVNSCHHQGIKTLAPGLRVEATAPDGLVEAVSCQNRKFLLAVQWHPEFNYHVELSSMKIFQQFVESCK